MNQKILFVIIGVIVLVVVGYMFVSNTSQDQEQTSTPPTKISVALDYFPYSAHAGLFIAKERGYFAEEGLDVDLHAPADVSTVLQTVALGRDDFGISYQPDLLLSRAEKVPVISVAALVQHPLYSIITLQNSGLSRPRDLVGKKVGYAGVPMDTLVLDTMLKSDGVTKGIKAVEFVNVGYDLVPALIGKRVDGIMGYFVDQSVSATNQGFPTNVMKATEYGVPDYYELVLITSEKKLADESEIVQKFVRAVKRGYEDASKDPQAAIQLMKQANPELDLSKENKGVELLVPLWRADNGVFGWQEESKWLAFVQWMKENDLLSQSVDARQAFTNRFIENAR